MINEINIKYINVSILKSIFIYIDIHIIYLLLMVIRSQIMEYRSANTN